MRPSSRSRRQSVTAALSCSIAAQAVDGNRLARCRTLVREKQFLEVVQEARSERRRPDAQVIAGDESLRLGTLERRLDDCQRITGALLDRGNGNAVDQPQGVQHELEADLARADL